MTRPDLDAIRARLKATTDGEWSQGEHEDIVTSQPMQIPSPWNDLVAHVYDEQNRPFVACAKQDIPALLAHIDAQAKEIERLTYELNLRCPEWVLDDADGLP